MALHGKFVINDADFSPLTIYGVGTFMAFSGKGAYRNRGACAHIPTEGPIPPGKYWIVERGQGGGLSKMWGGVKDLYNKISSGSEFMRSEWFALYRDGISISDYTWVNSVQRGLFRLHPGTISEGCITLPHNSDYSRLRNALLNTPMISVPCMKNLKAYGSIEVIINGSKNC